MDGSYRTREPRSEPTPPADLRRRPPQRPAVGDPYAPPVMKKDNSGAVVRAGVLALLLAGAAVGGYYYLQGADERVPLGQQSVEEAPASDTFAAASYPGESVNEGLEAPVAPLENAAPASTPEPAPRPVTRNRTPDPVPPPIVESTTPPPVVSATPPATITPMIPSEEPGAAPM